MAKDKTETKPLKVATIAAEILTEKGIDLPAGEILLEIQRRGVQAAIDEPKKALANIGVVRNRLRNPKAKKSEKGAKTGKKRGPKPSKVAKARKPRVTVGQKLATAEPTKVEAAPVATPKRRGRPAKDSVVPTSKALGITPDDPQAFRGIVKRMGTTKARELLDAIEQK
jgi:hypothetical protein